MKVLGCVLLILGTSIGAGMLALPVAMSQANLWVTLLTLLICWATMTFGALSILEVNLALPPGSNLITMAGRTLGRSGQVVMWFFYLFLLYSLLAAYLSGVGDVAQHLVCQLGLCWSRTWGTIIALFFLGLVVYCGLSSVDGLNRLLMSTKLVMLLFLVSVCSLHFSIPLAQQGHYVISSSMVLVVMTSFGFAIIVPSLRQYMNSDAKRLVKIVFFGSLLPLVIYLVWILAIQGVIPRSGSGGLVAMASSNHLNSLLMSKLARAVDVPFVSVAAKMFVSICVLTSFLGVSVCQVDFIADGLKMNKKGWASIVVYGVSYLPPLLLVLIWPGIFLKALSYAGICCAVILIIMPMLMLYSSRYFKRGSSTALVPGGRVAIMLVLCFGVGVLLTFIGQLVGG